MFECIYWQDLNCSLYPLCLFRMAEHHHPRIFEMSMRWRH